MSLNREKLNSVENPYYRINRIFLSTIKLWPYEQSMLATINRIFLCIIMLSFVFFQVTTFITFKYTTDFIITALAYIVPSILHIIQYYLFYINFDKVKQIWENIHDGWNNLKDETERNIMRKYSHHGELGTIILTLIMNIALLLYVNIEFLPTMLNIISPLNETRPCRIHALLEYFVNKETYYYPILCHWLIGLIFGCFVLTTTGTFQLAYIQYICGLLKITSYRMEHLIDECVTLNVQKTNCVIIQRITTAVDVHREALRCADLLTSTFISTGFFMIIIGVVSLSLNLFRLIRAMILQNIIVIISSILLIGGHLVIMFLCNYYLQKVTDHNNKIFYDAYNVRWYATPIKIQKLLLFIMKKTTKTYTFNIGNVIVASVEGFAKLSSMSLSYFMVIYSLMV